MYEKVNSSFVSMHADGSAAGRMRRRMLMDLRLIRRSIQRLRRKVMMQTHRQTAGHRAVLVI